MHANATRAEKRTDGRIDIDLHTMTVTPGVEHSLAALAGVQP